MPAVRLHGGGISAKILAESETVGESSLFISVWWHSKISVDLHFGSRTFLNSSPSTNSTYSLRYTCKSISFVCFVWRPAVCGSLRFFIRSGYDFLFNEFLF